MIFLSEHKRFSVFSWVMDLIILSLFVLIGMDQHDIVLSVWNQLLVALPFVLSWSIIGFSLGSFRIGREIARFPFLSTLVGAWFFALAMTLVIRSLAFDKHFIFTFALVSFLFNGILFVLWRIIYVHWCMPKETNDPSSIASTGVQHPK